MAHGKESSATSSSSSSSSSSSTTSEMKGTVWTERSSRVQRRYTFQPDGVAVEESSVLQADNILAKLEESFILNFFPAGFPHSVAEGYLEFSYFRAIQHVAQAAIAVVSTQSLLVAAGLRPTPAQATVVSWVVKDGMNNLGRIVSSRLGGRMDSDPKRWRVLGDALQDAGAFLEVLSPLSPQQFLPLAGAANAAKGMALAIARSTRLPIYDAFARTGNISDLYAKGEAASVVSTLMGYGLGWYLCASLCVSVHAKLLAMPVLAAVHIGAVTEEMRRVPINTLNRQRLDLITSEFLKSRTVPNPAQMRFEERIVLPARRIAFGRTPHSCVHLGALSDRQRIGSDGRNVNDRLDKATDPGNTGSPLPSQLQPLLPLFQKERFFIMPGDGGKGAVLVLHAAASGRDAAHGWLAAARLAALLESSGGDTSAEALVRRAVADGNAELPDMLACLERAGWHTDMFLDNGDKRKRW